MGFSLRNVFKKGSARGARAIVFEEQGSASDFGEGGVDVISSAWSGSGGPVPSPFKEETDEESLNGVDLFGENSLAPASAAGTAGEWADFDGRVSAPSWGQPGSAWPAPGGATNLPMDPAAAPLPRNHDCQTARELENRGFRPLSSASNRGEVPPVIPSMERPPNEQPSVNQSPQSNRGFHSPFEGAGAGPDPGQPPSRPVPASPFEIDPGSNPPPAADAAWPSPGSSGSGRLPGLPEAGTVASPFENGMSPQIPSGLFPRSPMESGIEPQSRPRPTPVETHQNLPSSVLEDPREFVEMSVLQLLGTVPPQELGAPAQAISPETMTRIPMAMLKPQLPSGRVFLNVSDVIVGCRPEHRAEMLGYRPDLRIKVPIALIFPNVRAGEATAPLPNPFEKASVNAPDRGETADTAPERSEPETVTIPPLAPTAPELAPSPAPYAGSADPAPQGAGEFGLPKLGGSGTEATHFDQTSAAPIAPIGEASEALGRPVTDPSCNVDGPGDAEPPGEIGTPLATLGPLGTSPFQSEAESSPVEEPQAPTSPLPPLMPAGGGDVEGLPESPDGDPRAPLPPHEPMPASSGGWPFDGNQTNLPPLGPNVIESLEDLSPLGEEGEEVAPEGFGGIGAPPTDRQATLRGLFLTDGMIDAERVAAHCSELPGVESCVVLGDASILVADSPESGEFGGEASRLHRSLLELLDAAGVADSQRLTVRTDQNLVSFFAGEEFAIAVRHAPEGFRPGVQERLAMIARELGNLASQQS